MKGSTAERSRDVALGNGFIVQAICSLNLMVIVSYVSTTVVSIVKRIRLQITYSSVDRCQDRMLGWVSIFVL